MKRRICFPAVFAALFFAVSFFAEVQSARAGLIAVDVVESPFMVDATFEWTEEGTEEPFVLSGLNDWFIQLKIIDNTETTGEWDLDILVSHGEPHGGFNRSGATGGIVASFDKGLFGQVLDLDGAMLHNSVIPDVEGYIGPPQTTHFDLLSFEVYRDSVPGKVNTIRVRGRHIPEPNTFGLLVVAIILVGFVYLTLRFLGTRVTHVS